MSFDMLMLYGRCFISSRIFLVNQNNAINYLGLSKYFKRIEAR